MTAVIPHPHETREPLVRIFKAENVEFLDSGTGESLLTKAGRRHGDGDSDDYHQHHHRKLATVDEVTLRFRYNGSVIERRVPAGSS